MRGRAWLMAAAMIGCALAGIRTANAQDATPRGVDALPGRIAPAVTPAPIGALGGADSDVRSTAKTSLILAGSLSVGAMYAASLAVAASSDNPADRYLAIPFAGPWVDLASRDECRAVAAQPQLDAGEGAPPAAKPNACSARGAVRDDDASRALLAANGVTQGLGLLSVVTGILIPSAKGKTVTIRPRAGLTSMAVEATARF